MEEQNDFSEQFLTDFIVSQTTRIETRKDIQDFLFFVTCQVASAGLALLLFQWAVSFFFTALICQMVAWLPAFQGAKGLELRRTQEGWDFTLPDPIKATIKFAVSVGFVSCSLYSIRAELKATESQISEIYTRIRLFEAPHPSDFFPEGTGLYLLLSFAIVSVSMFIKRD
ncbi:MAG: hypothetical protein F6K21_05660 [Symploca sp. SIO2D2]|nr:hypothetical protein [Symploca sp. SIO2D2]